MTDSKNIKVYILSNGQNFIGYESNNMVEYPCWIMPVPVSQTKIEYTFLPLIAEFLYEENIPVPTNNVLTIISNDKIDQNIKQGYERFIVRYKASLSGLTIPQSNKLILK